LPADWVPTTPCLMPGFLHNRRVRSLAQNTSEESPSKLEIEMLGREELFEDLQLEIGALIKILDRQIGRRRMSLELRLQLETVEELLSFV